MSDIRYLDELGDALQDAIRAPGAKRHRSWSGPVVALAAFVAVMAAGALLWTIRAPQESVAPPSSTTTLPAATPSPLPLEWGRVPHQDVFDSEQSLLLTGIDHGPGGYIAVGFEVMRDASGEAQVVEPSYRGVLVASADGVTWVDAGAGVYQDENMFQDVAIGPNGFALAGSGSDNRVRFWTSPDGTTWQPSTVEESGNLEAAAVGSVISVGDGFVAVGHGLTGGGRDSTTTGVAWLSASGGTWTETIVSSFADGSLGRVIAVGDTIYSGGVFADADGRSDAAVWTSGDEGVTWSRTILPRTDSDGFVGVSGLAPMPLGLVAVGFERDGGAIWLSADGVAWERVDDPDGVFRTEGSATHLYDVVATDAGLVVTGVVSRFSDARRVTWISKDGTEWMRLDLEEPTVIEGSSTIAYAFATDGQTIVTVGGERTVDERGVGAVWMSPPPQGVEPTPPVEAASEAGPGESTIEIRPDRGVAVTDVDVTVGGDDGTVTVVMIDSAGARHERCAIDVSYGQGRCTFEIGDLPAGSYTVSIEDLEVVDEPSFEVLPPGSDVLVLRVNYSATMWPLVNMVSVKNHGAEPVDVSGWSIQETESDRFTFPAGTVVKAGKSVGVIQSSRGGPFACPEGGPSYFYVCLDNDDDGWHGASLYLLNVDGNEIDRWSR